MRHENLLMLSATGASGPWGVQLAKERGHRVTAVLRSVSKLQNASGVPVIEGAY